MSAAVITSNYIATDDITADEQRTALWVVMMDVISEILTGVLKFTSKFLPIHPTHARRGSDSKAALIL